jgi:L-lactate utilization protein LutC
VEGDAPVSARGRILERVRAASGAGAPKAARAEAVAARLAQAPVHATPAQASSTGAERIAQFTAKAEGAAATVSHLAALAELPAALAHELRNLNLPAAIRTGSEPIFADLDWGTLDVTQGVGRLEEPATLSRAEFALAETGTLVLASGPQNPVTLTFLGETHFAVLRESDICGGFEDFWPAWRARGLDPRTLNMVTGPSRSADIGQVLQLGAHGPIALHVFLLED